jgi:Diacylglycerol acyltransferase
MQHFTVEDIAAGVKGTPMPHCVPITVVMGKPFQVPHIADPTHEQVHAFAGCLQPMSS